MSIPAAQTVAILLAAGRSQRFPGDKLTAELGGRPLLAHAARTLAGLPFLARIAVTSPDRPERAARLSALGFEIVENPEPERGQGSSLRVAAAAAAAHVPAAILLALADMPFVPEAHFRALLARLDAGNTQSLAFSQAAGGWRGPPAAFGAGWLGRLASAEGDRGARPILAAAPASAGIAAPDSWLDDLDTPADFERARRGLTLP